MLDSTVALAVTFAALVVFAAIGVAGAGRFGARDRDRYLTARASQGTLALSLSFFASALGTWILFSPPEVGTFGGFLGIFGYALAQAVAIAVFAILGPPIRDRLPEGSTILEFVRQRYGRAKHLYVGAVSVLYMFVFLTAELTAVGGVLALVAGADPLVPIVAVAAATALYTAYGGLPASLQTDRWQAWLILGLLVIGAVAVAGRVAEPAASARAGGVLELSRPGAEVMVVLVIAVVAANLFHQGFWQRVWSARDHRSVVRGALGGGALILPVVFLLGAAGTLAAGLGRAEDPSVAFFGLLQEAPAPVLAAVVGLAVALVASSVDTLQNALTSLVAGHVGAGRMSLPAARAVTVLLTVPAVAIAVRGVSVLRLFLVADLLAATVVFPVFLGLWRRATAPAAVAGAAAGVLSVVLLGWAQTGSAVRGLLLLTLPPDASLLGPFVAAIVGSAVVTVAASFVRRREGPRGGTAGDGSAARGRAVSR